MKASVMNRGLCFMGVPPTGAGYTRFNQEQPFLTSYTKKYISERQELNHFSAE